MEGGEETYRSMLDKQDMIRGEDAKDASQDEVDGERERGGERRRREEEGGCGFNREEWEGSVRGR